MKIGNGDPHCGIGVSRNTRLANCAKVILAPDTSGGRFRWQSMAADGSRNRKLAGSPRPFPP